MTRSHGRKFCVNCGDGFRGAGRLCADCVPASTVGRPEPAAICKPCGAPVGWNTVRRVSRTVDDNWIECMYYCGACGGILEFAAWGSKP